MQNTLTASAKIDRRFARRFPQRVCWLRPATPAERQELFGGPLEGWQPCVAVWQKEGDFIVFPFLASSADVADTFDGIAADVAAKAATALRDGGIARIQIKRSGRQL